MLSYIERSVGSSHAGRSCLRDRDRLTNMIYILLVLSGLAVAFALAALAVGLALAYKVDRLAAQLATHKDLREVVSDGNKELGERFNANQGLLRKRIDHLEETTKRHSSRIDVLKAELTTGISASTAALSAQIADALPDEDAPVAEEGDDLPRVRFRSNR